MKYNLAFIGFGTVGQGLANLLSGALIEGERTDDRHRIDYSTTPLASSGQAL